MSSEPSKVREMPEVVKKWIAAGSPSIEELQQMVEQMKGGQLPVELSETRLPTNYRFWGIAIGVIMFFAVSGYKMGGKDVDTARSLNMLTLRVEAVAKIVGPISTALDGVRLEISGLKDEVVRLQRSQSGYDIELAQTRTDIEALEKILTNTITNGDKRSIDLFNSLNSKVIRNENHLSTLKGRFNAVHE